MGGGGGGGGEGWGGKGGGGEGKDKGGILDIHTEYTAVQNCQSTCIHGHGQIVRVLVLACEFTASISAVSNVLRCTSVFN